MDSNDDEPTYGHTLVRRKLRGWAGERWCIAERDQTDETDSLRPRHMISSGLDDLTACMPSIKPQYPVLGSLLTAV